MSPLTFVALAFTLAQQAAIPRQAAVSGTVLEEGSGERCGGGGAPRLDARRPCCADE
jgi:hypothetical protein